MHKGGVHCSFIQSVDLHLALLIRIKLECSLENAQIVQAFAETKCT